MAGRDFDPGRVLRDRPGLVAAGIAVLAGVAVFLVAHRVFPYYSTNHDEAVYLQQAAMLLEGRLYLRPPVEGVFRPWFFVESPEGLYPKYAPLPAATFAVGLLAGDPRLALALTGTAVVAGVYGVVREAFHPDDPATLTGRRTALLAAALTVASPQFLVETSLFLPYAPTAVWNLLFAAPFVAHALWTLRGGEAVAGVDAAALARHLPTAALGLAGVGATLWYNALLTGDPLLFPYEAFAPLDGLGFGTRAIAGYSRDYTPALALSANARVLAHLLARWTVAGPLGAGLAAVGLGTLLARGRDADPRQLVLAGLFVSVVVGNVYFWGNLNVLGELSDPDDGLVSLLGPYYHYDLLAPLSAFGAVGLLRVADLLRTGVPDALAARGVSRPVAARVGAAALLVTWGALGAAAGVTASGPLAENREVSANLADAYVPVEERELSNAVVFLPTPYGDWLNHPFQALRNDPGYDGDAVYAMDDRRFAVVDAYPEREYYRYGYRGEWAPFAGESVEPRLQRVRHVRGDAVRLTATLGIPEGAKVVSVRLRGAEESAFFSVAGPPDRLALSVRMADGRATLSGAGVEPRAEPSVDLPDGGEVVVEVNVEFNPSYSLTYRLTVPVARAGEDVRALTPAVAACRNPRRCGGEAAYVPGSMGPGVSVTTGLGVAGNRSG